MSDGSFLRALSVVAVIVLFLVILKLGVAMIVNEVLKMRQNLDADEMDRLERADPGYVADIIADYERRLRGETPPSRFPPESLRDYYSECVGRDDFHGYRGRS